MRYPILLALLCWGSLLKAQDGYRFIGLKAGMAYQKAFAISATLDLAAPYHGAYELSASYYRNYGAASFNALLGLSYKPVLYRDKNWTARWRFGGELGSDWSGFVAGPELGFDLNKSISPKVDLVFSNRNAHMFFAQRGQRWRVLAEIGFRLAL